MPPPRRKTRQLNVGGVLVGGDAPISVQSMTTTKTADVDGTLRQIYALAAAGCDIVAVGAVLSIVIVLTSVIGLMPLAASVSNTVAAELAGTDKLQIEAWHVMFLARGKRGPFRAEGESRWLSGWADDRLSAAIPAFLKSCARFLTRADTAAFDAYLAAIRLPSGTDAEKAERDGDLQRAPHRVLEEPRADTGVADRDDVERFLDVVGVQLLVEVHAEVLGLGREWHLAIAQKTGAAQAKGVATQLANSGADRSSDDW